MKSLAERVGNLSRRTAVVFGLGFLAAGVAESVVGFETNNPVHNVIGVIALGGAMYVGVNAPNMHGVLNDSETSQESLQE